MSDLLTRLIAAGTPADLIAEVAMLCARAEVDREAIETRRTKDRERQATRRNVTSRDTADVADTPPSLDKEIPPRPPKEINSIPRVSATPARATRIPQDWTPAKPLPPEVGELCAQWPPGRLERELAGFRDYWVSRVKDAARTDWDRTWWNRIRDQHDRILRDSRNGSNQSVVRPGADPLRGTRPDPSLDMLYAARAAGAASDWGDRREVGASVPAIWAG